ncbi:NAD(+) diphosphatase [Methylobacterium sp. Leaf466]|uniref:NAD(+) diphosphatase n=1 Tax=Methylobacterium sp. Leaf466 TaxID=1736386 RepID=UPI0006FF0523|nr:NAD(+) diphosphatase [Methylobacterium sp. Leaf466]KQT80620.1 NADH pyrophosphatase [Methylobacterium sp. Leaf466]
MADRPDYGLGYARSRLVRHSAEREAPPFPPEAAEALTVCVAPDGIVLSGDTALLSHDLAPGAGERSLTIYLGRVDGRPVFAAALTAEAGGRFDVVDLRSLASAGRVAPDELGVVATARSFLSWHARNGFCAHCGTATAVAAAGFRRDCPACGAHHFPRTDPVAIMLITRGDACLLGRGPHFPPDMYSCLAGFIEPGETIEDAVRRESFEEAGVRIGAVTYLASQPWPFPSSLMIGCVAESLTEAITRDAAELEDARWFSRDEVTAMIVGAHPGGLSTPPPMAIAHLLMRSFVAGTTVAAYEEYFTEQP